MATGTDVCEVIVSLNPLAGLGLVVSHLLAPAGHSINDYIDQATIYDAVAILTTLGGQCPAMPHMGNTRVHSHVLMVMANSNLTAHSRTCLQPSCYLPHHTVNR